MHHVRFFDLSLFDQGLLRDTSTLTRKMLNNITAESIHYANRCTAQPLNGYSGDGSYSPGVMFTPYAPATSIPRFSYTNASPMLTQLDTNQTYPVASCERTFSRGAVTAALPQTAPVYAPSTPSPYQLFVDPATGATLTIDDDEMLIHRTGYALPSAGAAAMPNVTVGRQPSPTAVCYDGQDYMTHTSDHCPCVYCAAAPPSGDVLPPQSPLAAPAVAPLEMPSFNPEPHLSVRVGVAASPKQPTLAGSFSTMSASQQYHTEDTPARSTRRSSKNESPSTSSRKTSAPVSNTASSTPSYAVDVIGHNGRTLQVVSHMPLDAGMHVVFEGDRGLDMGIVDRVSPSSGYTSTSDTAMVVRNATREEIALWTEELPALAAEATKECSVLVASMGLRMRVVEASFQLDKQKLTFFYETTEPRVDFRKLLIELFNRYRCRIWMEKKQKNSA